LEDKPNASLVQPPVVLYLVGEDWIFLLHRLPMALAAQRAGYRVHVATHVNSDADTIEKMGFVVHPMPWRRGTINPLYALKIVRTLRALYRKVSPAIVHHIALQPVVTGSIAAAGLPMSRINSITGFGFTFTSNTLKARLIRRLLPALLRPLLNSARAVTSVENPDDKQVLEAMGVRRDKIVVFPGSGVDTEKFKPVPEPDGPITVAFVGRLLDDKGLRTLVRAHDLLRQRGKTIRLLIVGERDPSNASSIPAGEIDGWKQQPGIELLGHVSNINDVWAAAHIAVLPSRREGLPVTLLEAAACARAIVATDVPGCREIARAGINALLVPAEDPAALAEAIWALATNVGLRRKFAVAGRKIVEAEYSSAIVGRATNDLYDRVLGRGKAPAL
jgi:glycosyltransferase involved in cell wall biosynthesis